jgi:hypothetical protein
LLSVLHIYLHVRATPYMEVQHCYWNFILIDISFLFSARAVRTHWGNLVRSGVVKRDYREVSINNVITLGTRVRIVIMRVGFCQLLLIEFFRVFGFNWRQKDVALIKNNLLSLGYRWCVQEATSGWVRHGNPIPTKASATSPGADDTPPNSVQLRRLSVLHRAATSYSWVVKVIVDMCCSFSTTEHHIIPICKNIA